MKYMVEKKIDNLGRIVLPKNMRDYYSISLNDTLALIPTDEGILIVKQNLSNKPDEPISTGTTVNNSRKI